MIRMNILTFLILFLFIIIFGGFLSFEIEMWIRKLIHIIQTNKGKFKTERYNYKEISPPLISGSGEGNYFFRKVIYSNRRYLILYDSYLKLDFINQSLDTFINLPYSDIINLRSKRYGFPWCINIMEIKWLKNKEEKTFSIAVFSTKLIIKQIKKIYPKLNI